MNIIGERIKELRKSKGMTQEELANELRTNFNLSVDRVMISKWETGYQTPQIYNIMCLSKIFNVSSDYITGEKDYIAYEKIKNSPTKSADEQLFELFSQLTQENKNKIIELLEMYVDSQEKQ